MGLTNIDFTQFSPMLHFVPPQNVGKLLVFWRFQGV